jgi:predicted Zn finger-like uncharacterized protein
MDVRCDRCQTEYELDDDSVTETGASVQCTTCGHTFVVGPDGAVVAGQRTPPGGTIEMAAGPQVPEWLLATEDGQTHRFRDLTTLQKWVVERKVTREDRVSHKGGLWRHLAEVPELDPFFEVVAQADRARSADLAHRSPAPSPVPGAIPQAARGTAPGRAPVGARQPGATPQPHVEGVAGRGRSARRDSMGAPLLDPSAADDRYETMAILPNNRLLKIAGATGIIGLAVTAAYVGFKQPHWLPFFSRPTEAPRVAEAHPAPPPPPATLPVPLPPVAAVPPPAPPSAAATAPVIEALPSKAAAAPPPVERAAAEPPAHARSYERLVADADRLMENGQTARAQRLLDEALAQQPNGVAAITGSAYLQLDRQKALAAISTFKRALGLSPEYPPALFGLAEAYRAQGEVAQAADNYRKYLGVAPGGPDAPAARRQLKDIESSAPRKAPPASAGDSEPPPSAKESAKAEPPAPSADDQPGAP